ncbi:hypothetical protein PIB30_073486 [Stylosanthes scabra]|uniref:Uncharacterized protein n=1 Tax=Stylosanthes scabra TaxID=79078 RepID=A0ABU6ZN68_9FABA|nr:hypothetical protein [Stylosanthes scabra]
MFVKSYSMKLADRGSPSNVAPTLSLPPKKCPIPVPTKASGEDTSKATTKTICRRSQRIAAKGGSSTNAPKEKVVIAISSDSEPELKLEDTIHEIVEMDRDQEEDPEEDPEEAPRMPRLRKRKKTQKKTQHKKTKRILKKFFVEKMITWTTRHMWTLNLRISPETIHVSGIMMVISPTGRTRNHPTALLEVAPDCL